MPTNLLYLDDTYLHTGTGTVLSTESDERGGYLILDQTVFYPQGGGQPADKGTLQIDGESLPLTFVGFQDGDVRHYLADEHLRDNFIGKTANQNIDTANRLANAKLHTGAHLVSHVLETLNESLIPVKGYSFPDGSYVEFMNEQNVDLTPLVEQANADLANDISACISVSVALSDFPTITRLRPVLAPFTPKAKPTRIVTIGDYISVPCGGTHLASLNEMTGVMITKFKRQKGNLRVSYSVS